MDRGSNSPPILRLEKAAGRFCDIAGPKHGMLSRGRAAGAEGSRAEGCEDGGRRGEGRDGRWWLEQEEGEGVQRGDEVEEVEEV